MFKFLTIVVASCLVQHIIACCCFRDAWTLPSCGCADIIVTGSNPCNPAPSSCGLPCYRDTCNCGPPCYRDTCNCGPPGPCYRDTCNCGPPCYRDTCNCGPPCYRDTCNCGPPGPCYRDTCNCGPPGPCYRDTCNCSPPGPCYRDITDVCVVYDNPSPVCSCLKNTEPAKCGCGFDQKYIYFPEVEYPTIALDVKPYYYSSCWSV